MCAKGKHTGFRELAEFESKSLLCQIPARTQGELCKPKSVKIFHAMLWHWQQTGTSDHLGVFFCIEKQQQCPPSLKCCLDGQITDGKIGVTNAGWP